MTQVVGSVAGSKVFLSTVPLGRMLLRIEAEASGTRIPNTHFWVAFGEESSGIFDVSVIPLTELVDIEKYMLWDFRKSNPQPFERRDATETILLRRIPDDSQFRGGCSCTLLRARVALYSRSLECNSLLYTTLLLSGRELYFGTYFTVREYALMSFFRVREYDFTASSLKFESDLYSTFLGVQIFCDLLGLWTRLRGLRYEGETLLLVSKGLLESNNITSLKGAVMPNLMEIGQPGSCLLY